MNFEGALLFIAATASIGSAGGAAYAQHLVDRDNPIKRPQAIAAYAQIAGAVAILLTILKDGLFP